MSNNTTTTRIEAFSDGVFAIAITLLILEIKVPPAHSVNSVAELWSGLAHLWPSYFAFVLSFGFILIAWINHHAVFALINKSSGKLLFANGFLLLNIAFLPFATGMLAEYIDSEHKQPAIFIYCFSYVLQNAGWNLLAAAIAKSELVKNDVAAHTMFARLVKLSRYGFWIYVVITAIAWWFPTTALVLNMLLWVVWLATGLMTSK
jgi:uncharacterized membrane protein